MTTLELDAFKAELIKEICQADSLDEVLRVAHSCTKPYEAYQPGELNQVREDIAAFEAERKEGIPGIPANEAAEQLEKEFPWLK